MKEKLVNIYNGMNMLSVRGQDVMVLAQCMSQLAEILNNMPDDEKKEDRAEK